MKASLRLSLDGPVHQALEAVLAKCDVEASIARDPIEYVRRQTSPENIELVGLVAACVAFGNVTALRSKLDEALRRIGPDLARAADDEERLHASLSTWKHRVYRGDDLARLIIGARRVQRAAGSLGARFGIELRAHGTLREALAAFVDAIRQEGGLDRVATRGARHLMPDPRGPSGCKRLLLFLRWMVRGPDRVDLGLWRAHVPVDLLLIPVDVHIHKLSKNLGLTRRATTSWKTTEEITAALRRFDESDPVRFDFALCHLGMLRRCPSRKDSVRCEGCGVKPVCRFWPTR